MARVTHFDISGENPKGLLPFYETIFGWKFQKWDGPMEYYVITTGAEGTPGINGGLGRRQRDSATVNTIEVDDLDLTIQQVKAHKGTIVSGKSPIPGMGWYAQFKDPEQNEFGILQRDPNAK